MGCPRKPAKHHKTPAPCTPGRISHQAGFSSHLIEQAGMKKCDKATNRKTRYMSVRVQPALASAVAEEAADYGVSASKFVRIVLIETVQRRRARRRMLGLDRLPRLR